MMERIVYLDRSALRTAVRRPAFEHEWIEYPTTRPEEVKARLKGATIAITHRVFLKGDNLPPTLRLIAVGSTGYERIDLAACRARGIHVGNVRAWSVHTARGLGQPGVVGQPGGTTHPKHRSVCARIAAQPSLDSHTEKKA